MGFRGSVPLTPNEQQVRILLYRNDGVARGPHCPRMRRNHINCEDFLEEQHRHRVRSLVNDRHRELHLFAKLISIDDEFYLA